MDWLASQIYFSSLLLGEFIRSTGLSESTQLSVEGSFVIFHPLHSCLKPSQFILAILEFKTCDNEL